MFYQNTCSLSTLAERTVQFWTMGVVGAAVVGFVAGIACAILIDEVFSLDGGLWDLLGILIGIGGAAVAVRLVHLRSHPRGPRHHRHA